MNHYRREDETSLNAMIALLCFGGVALTVFLMTMLEGKPGPVTQAVRAEIAEVGK